MIIAKIIKENYRENAINTKLVENFTDITECFTLGELPQIIKQELMSNSKTLQISFGNLVKNIAKHSEVDFLMFKKVIEYLNDHNMASEVRNLSNQVEIQQTDKD